MAVLSPAAITRIIRTTFNKPSLGIFPASLIKSYTTWVLSGVRATKNQNKKL
jgi:hypothetical protein